MHLDSKFSAGTWLGAAAAVLFIASGAAAATAVAVPDTTTYPGAPLQIGEGTARVVAVADVNGRPLSIAVEMTPGALDGLPTELNKTTSEGQWEYSLPVPAEAHTGFTEVVVDWNPHGHPPQDIYTVPHFDFHFYDVDSKTVEGIKFSGPTDPAANVSDLGLVPTDYHVVPDTVVNRMGVHAIDTTAPEFNGTPFTAAFIYGYYKDKLIFVEPMVTRAFLQSHPDFSAPVKTPAHYSLPGYYPTKYSVSYDAAGERYLVQLSGLEQSK